MSDLKDDLRRAADRHEPPADWLERIHERTRRKRRNQRVLAGVVGLGLSVVLVAGLVTELWTRAPSSPGARTTRSAFE